MLKVRNVVYGLTFTWKLESVLKAAWPSYPVCVAFSKYTIAGNDQDAPDQVRHTCH